MNLIKSLIIISSITLFNHFSAQSQMYNPPGTTPAPTKGVVKGKVMDASANIPMDFASIALYKTADSSLLTGTISGNGGSFIIPDVPFGKYYMIANFMGFEKYAVSDIIVTPQRHVFDVGVVKLKPATTELEEVEIIADQAHVEYKIDRKVVNVSQDINAATGTAADVLQNTPSVQVDIEGNVTLRGSGNFTVLIDGKPTALTGSDALQQIPASAVKSIEIITNPSAKFDPDGMAGIINIIPKKNALQGLSGIFNTSIGTGDKYSADFLINYRTSKFNVFAGMNYNDNTYRGTYKGTSEFLGDTTRFVSSSGNRDMTRSGYEIKTGADWYIDEFNTLSFSLNTGSHDFGFGGTQKMRNYNDPLSYDLYSLTNTSNNHGGSYYDLNLSYTRKFEKPGHELVAYVYFEGETGDDGDTQTEFPADNNYNPLTGSVAERIRTAETGKEKDFRAQIDYTRPIGSDGKLEAGYQARIDDEYEDYLFENYDFLNDEWIYNPLFSSNNDFYRNIQSVYTTFGNKIGNFQFQAGLRGEYTNREIRYANESDTASINRFDIFPTLHLSRSFKNNHQLMASYSRRINRPRGWDLEPFLSYMDANTLRQGNPDLLPEYMNSFEINYQKTFGKSFISFETYLKNTVNKMERVITVYDPENAIRLMTIDNLANDYSLGGELMLNWNKLKWIEMNMSTSVYRYWLEGTISGEDISRRSNNWDSRLNATFNINSKTRMQLQTFYMGPSVTAQGDRSAFFFSNIAVRRDFLDRKLSATLQVRDIFGTMKHEMNVYSSGFNSMNTMRRESQVVMLSLSYKLNNYKQRRSDSNMENDMGGDGDMF